MSDEAGNDAAATAKAGEGRDMIADVVVADWIKRIAEDERKRDAVRAREEEVAARKAQFVRQNGQRLLDDIRATVVRDIAAFRAEFPEEGTRRIVLDLSESGGGFVVSKPAPPAVALAVMPDL